MTALMNILVALLYFHHVSPFHLMYNVSNPQASPTLHVFVCVVYGVRCMHAAICPLASSL